jgi:hypothetical protein
MKSMPLVNAKTSHPPAAFKFNQNKRTIQILPEHDSATVIDRPRPSEVSATPRPTQGQLALAHICRSVLKLATIDT